MRKLTISALMTAALSTIACGSAYAVLEESKVAAAAPALHELSIHPIHDGRPRRSGHAPLFAS